jgi:hypothetical protein
MNTMMMKRFVSRLAVVLAMLLGTSAVFGQGTKEVPANYKCFLPAPPQPAKVAGVVYEGLGGLSSMYPGDEAKFSPKVRMTRGPLTGELAVASSDALVAQATFDPGSGIMTVKAISPGQASIVISPSRDNSKAVTVPVTVKKLPAQAAAALPPQAGGGFPWWTLLFLLLAIPAYFLGRRNSEQAREEGREEGREAGQRAEAARLRDEVNEANRRRQLAEQALNQAEVDLLRLRAQQNALVQEAVAAAVADRDRQIQQQQEELVRLENQLNEIRPLFEQLARNVREAAQAAERINGVLNPQAQAAIAAAR